MQAWAARFPKAAAAARAQTNAKVNNNAFEAARAGRRLAGWQPGNVTVRRESLDFPALRRRAYDLARNNPLAVALIDRLDSEIIGTGILPRVQTTDDADQRLVQQINALWDAWANDCLVGPRLDYYGWQSLALAEWVVGGDAITQLRTLPTKSSVPLRLALLGADRLARSADTSLFAQKNVVDGIETDASGMIVNYWLYPTRPDAGGWGGVEHKPVPVPAAQIAHLFTPRRAEQMRGATRFASAMVRLHGLDLYQDNVLERQKLQNLFAAFVLKKSTSDAARDAFGLATGVAGAGGATEKFLPTLEPGMVAEVDGDDIKFSNPQDAGANYEQFCVRQIMDICAAFGVPYQIVTNDFAKANDREMRVALNSFRRTLRKMIHTQLVPMLLQPVRDAWFDSAILAGALPARANQYRRTQWVPTRWEYINPKQDAEAAIALINAGLQSRTGYLLAGEDDPQEVDRQRALDAQREAALGLSADE